MPTDPSRCASGLSEATAEFSVVDDATRPCGRRVARAAMTAGAGSIAVTADPLTRARDFLARRRSDLEAVTVLVGLIAEVERLRERGAEQDVQHAVAAHIRHVRRLANDVDDIRAALQCAVDEDAEPDPIPEEAPR